jgi:hypothetical protein
MVAFTPGCAQNTRKALYVLALGIPVFIAYTGAAGIVTVQVSKNYSSTSNTSNTNEDSSIVFMGLYILFFAALLFIYECCVICPVQVVDDYMRKNFGFFYGPVGRGGSLLSIC